MTRLQSAKNRITDLDEELRIVKQDLKNLNLSMQFNVSNKLKEKKKCDRERFSKFVEKENSPELFVNENKEPSKHILRSLISDQTLMDLESKAA